MPSKSRADSKLNLLVAYPYATAPVLSRIQENAEHIRFVLDSGAFTAWRAGKTIELDDYCRFIEKLPVKPWRYFTLDVIGNPHATLKNYETMRKRGFKPVPIFTRGEDVSVLESYYNTSDLVGVGGLVGTEGNRGFVKGIMEKVGKRKVHWLGFTNLAFMRVFRPFMADSSGWGAGGRYGAVTLYLGGGRTAKLTRTTAKKDLQDARIRARLVQFGMDPLWFLQEECWRGGMSPARQLGALSIVAIQRDYLGNFGTHVFAAAAVEYELRLLLKARHIVYEGGTYERH